MAIYLTLFYTKKELALRIAYLFVSAALAGATGGLLAYAIGFMDGAAGLRGWRWIMIIEGLPTFVLGIATFFILADDPAHASYLSPAEKALMIVRQNRQVGQTDSAQRFHRKDVRRGLTDWKVYVFCVAQFGADTMLYGYSTFLPTIIKTFGHWSAAQTQALTIPCYVLGAVSYLLVARLSDRQQLRGLYCVIFGLVSIVGYGILMADTGPGVHYFACFVIALGLYVVVGLPLAWLPTNCPRYGKRTTAGGMQLMIGNTSGIMAPFVSSVLCNSLLRTYPLLHPRLCFPPCEKTDWKQLYPTSSGPRYIKGHAVSLAMVACATLLYGFMSLYFRRVNARRERGDEDGKVQGMSEEEARELGDRSPGYRFTY